MPLEAPEDAGAVAAAEPCGFVATSLVGANTYDINASRGGCAVCRNTITGTNGLVQPEAINSTISVSNVLDSKAKTRYL